MKSIKKPLNRRLNYYFFFFYKSNDTKQNNITLTFSSVNKS